jgi:membrane-bound lytic murein transglycosylase D
LFSDIKNFKTLKVSGPFHDPTKDSVTYDVPIVFNEKVANSLAYLQTVAHETFETYLSRSSKYIPHMEKILAEEGLPHDLVYLPLIESGFNPHAYSYARAVGPWQFISSTGKRYGLNRDWWYDERRDFEKSTRAAARYLKDLYEEFGSWELALAAYNGGEGRVRIEIRRAKSKDFWKLKLARQTRNYIPLFMAATIIAKQPQKYGFFPEYEDPLAWETVDISKCISFKNIAEATAIPVADLELLNPSLIRGVTPPNAKNHKLRVPIGYGDKLRAAHDNIPSEKNTNWVRHTIRKGETVSTIARKYGVSLSSLISANDLHRPYRIYVGQSLIIPVTGGQIWDSHASDIIPDGSGYYVVRKGDTLWEIARAYGVSLTNLKRANRLSSNQIYPGRRLIIPGSVAKQSASSVAQQTTSSEGIYIVRAGDTLSKIARRFRMTVAELKNLNGLRSDRIFPNMKLNINKNSSSMTLSQVQDHLTTYKVKRGDTLWKIAQIFNVTVQDLIHWNQISNPSKLNRGEVLKIYVR